MQLTKEEARIVANIHDLLPNHYYLGKWANDDWTVFNLYNFTNFGTLQEVYIWAKKEFNKDELPFK